MTDPRLTYIGPSVASSESRPKMQVPLWRKLPLSFLLVVCLPTLLGAIYFLLIASPRYVSEARFLVRSASQDQPNSLGLALQGVGISSSSSDAFAVHEYINSRDGLRFLMTTVDVRRIFGAGNIDPFSRLPHPWQGDTFEDLYTGFKGYVTVGYDSTNGISTLKVEAFEPKDAQRIATTMLAGGEALINRLNARAERDAVDQASRTLVEAQGRADAAQQALTAFRNREQFIDPARTAQASAALIGELSVTLANLKAERSQVMSEAPQSPQLAALNGRIRAFEQQIAAEQARIAGDNTSLAPKIGVYEDLMQEKELADRLLLTATTGLNTAQLDARRQRLYLERVVDPSVPDKSTEPSRWLSILAVFATALLAYGTVWLIWSGVRESKQE
jgi:capsular polysaccharide transport system permease protein